MMIQHNDSDTSCMRAHVPAERTFASEAEHTLPLVTHDLPALGLLCIAYSLRLPLCLFLQCQGAVVLSHSMSSLCDVTHIW